MIRDDYYGAKWCQGGRVEVKVSKDLIVGREFGVQSGRPEHIEGCNCPGDEAAPQVKWKSFIFAIEDGDEVAFECSNCLFSQVVTVVMLICQLVMELFGLNGCNEFL